jgi:hypothetical protein
MQKSAAIPAIAMKDIPAPIVVLRALKLNLCAVPVNSNTNRMPDVLNMFLDAREESNGKSPRYRAWR